ncbi:MAG: DUF1972 domain-containing protein [Candidatus Latescibacteria bacterium]|jgi:glycosyltransferase involved in cell wall biosynthesis|nr:DUF1972 domain-containing protein [Candidatus Latescibacterota bacterium]
MESKKVKVAIIGTQGIPNQYGGFETLVEYLAKHLSNRFDITIFCSSVVYKSQKKELYGCKLEYLPLKANGIQSVAYDILSILKSVNKYDKLLVLGVSGGIILPLLRMYRDKFVLNFGGLDWQRDKWGKAAKKFLKFSENLAVRNSGTLIADNQGIQNYISNTYKQDSFLIEYGGNQAVKEVIGDSDIEKYPFLNNQYAMSVARIQPDNNVQMILEAFCQNTIIPLVFIGNWSASAYGCKMKKEFSNQNNIYLLDAIYDQKYLDVIRSNCDLYVHGHSAGGTNPTLVEAMSLGLPIFCYSSGFNEFTTEHKALYFEEKEQLKDLLNNTDKNTMINIGRDMKNIADRRYKWQIIVDKYAECLNKRTS